MSAQAAGADKKASEIYLPMLKKNDRRRWVGSFQVKKIFEVDKSDALGGVMMEGVTMYIFWKRGGKMPVAFNYTEYPKGLQM